MGVILIRWSSFNGDTQVDHEVFIDNGDEVAEQIWDQLIQDSNVFNLTLFRAVRHK